MRVFVFTAAVCYTYNMVSEEKHTIATHTAQPCTIAAIILTAGASSRMGQPKACLQWNNTTFLTTCVNHLRDANCTDIWCITGYFRDEIMSQHSDLPVQWIENPTPEEGMLSSFRCGVKQIAEDFDAVLLCLVDHPAITTETYTAVCSHASAETIIIPVYNGKRGHPTAFGKTFFDEIVHSDCPQGARTIIHKHTDAVREIAVNDPGIHLDIDTPAEYKEIQRKANIID